MTSWKPHWEHWLTKWITAWQGSMRALASILPFLRVCSWPFLVLYSNTNTRIWQFSPKKIYKRPSAPISTAKILFAAITYCRHFNLMVHLISGHGPQVIYCPSDFILLTSLPQTHFPCYVNSKPPLQFLPKMDINLWPNVTALFSSRDPFANWRDLCISVLAPAAACTTSCLLACSCNHCTFRRRCCRHPPPLLSDKMQYIHSSSHSSCTSLPWPLVGLSNSQPLVLSLVLLLLLLLLLQFQPSVEMHALAAASRRRDSAAWSEPAAPENNVVFPFWKNLPNLKLNLKLKVSFASLILLREPVKN